MSPHFCIQFRVQKTGDSIMTRIIMNPLPLSNIQQLQQEFNLYLTGSRYLNIHTERSDWDFMCSDSNIILALRNMGAIDITGRYNIPSNHANQIFRLNEFDFQILSPELLDRKLRAQELIYEVLQRGFVYPTNKEQKIKVWDWAMNTVNV